MWRGIAGAICFAVGSSMNHYKYTIFCGILCSKWINEVNNTPPDAGLTIAYLISAIALMLTLANPKFLWLPGLVSLALIIWAALYDFSACLCLEPIGLAWALLFAGPALMFSGAIKAKGTATKKEESP